MLVHRDPSTYQSFALNGHERYEGKREKNDLPFEESRKSIQAVSRHAKTKGERQQRRARRKTEGKKNFLKVPQEKKKKRNYIIVDAFHAVPTKEKSNTNYPTNINSIELHLSPSTKRNLATKRDRETEQRSQLDIGQSQQTTVDRQKKYIFRTIIRRSKLR